MTPQQAKTHSSFVTRCQRRAVSKFAFPFSFPVVSSTNVFFAVNVSLRYYLYKDECQLPHSSGSFTLLRQTVKEKFNRLEKTKINDLYFEYFEGNSKKGKLVENEFYFNMLVNNIEPN